MATHSSVLAWRIPMDRGIWWVTAHEVANSWTRLGTHIALKDSLKSKPDSCSFVLYIALGIWQFLYFCATVRIVQFL